MKTIMGRRNSPQLGESKISGNNTWEMKLWRGSLESTISSFKPLLCVECAYDSCRISESSEYLWSIISSSCFTTCNSSIEGSVM